MRHIKTLLVLTILATAVMLELTSNRNQTLAADFSCTSATCPEQRNAQAITGLKVVPVKKLATETPVVLDRLSLVEVQIAPRQAATEVAVAAVVAAAMNLEEDTATTIGSGILIVEATRIVSTSLGSTESLSLSRKRRFRPTSASLGMQ